MVRRRSQSSRLQRARHPADRRKEQEQRTATRPDRRQCSRRPRVGGRFFGNTLRQALGDPPAVLARHRERTAAQRFQCHIERQHLRLQTAPRAAVADGIQFILQVAQRPQLLDGRRHKTRILQNAVRYSNFLGHQCVVIENLRRTGSRQIIELATRGGSGNPLFDKCIKQFHLQSTTLRLGHFIRVSRNEFVRRLEDTPRFRICRMG
ncbi:hypothetical protein PSAB6_470042 [Paraburkholderia sabiae]|nr:hypothetical protein PSAB6_470042 [Paraburkholderia sabiae]